MKFVLPALLLCLAALLGSPAWVQASSGGLLVSEAGDDGTRIITNETNESADLDDARAIVKTIWTTARAAPALADEAKNQPTDQEIDASDMAGLRTLAFRAGTASIAAVETARANPRIGKATGGALETSITQLNQALEAVSAEDVEAHQAGLEETSEAIELADAEIARLTDNEPRQKALGIIMSNAKSAQSTITQIGDFVFSGNDGSASSIDAGNATLGAGEANVSGGSIIDKIRGVFTLGNTILFLVLIGWASTAYWGFANRSRYLGAQKRLEKSRGEVRDAQLKLTHKDQEVERLEDQKRAADARAQEGSAAVLAAKASKATEDEGAHLRRRAPVPPPPPRSKVPDLKREIDAYLSSGGRLKQGDYRAILANYGTLHGLALTEDRTASLQDDESTQLRHVTGVVLAETGEVAIVPSAYFVSKFSMQFTSELQLSAETKAFFDISPGIPKKLSVDSVGSARMLDHGSVTDIRKGSLSGFELS